MGCWFVSVLEGSSNRLDTGIVIIMNNISSNSF